MLKISLCKLSKSAAISAQFTLKHVCRSPKLQKITKTPYFGGSRLFKVIDVDISKKFVASACYDMQQVCAYLQPFAR